MRSVPIIVFICLLILFLRRDKHWEYRDELPLRLTVAGSILFIYGTVWQELSRHLYYFCGALTAASALAIVAAMVMAFLNKEAKLRRILLCLAPLPIILFMLLHTPLDSPAHDEASIPGILIPVKDAANQ